MDKACSKCAIVKPLSEYEKQGRNSHRAKCKACRSEEHLSQLRKTKYGLDVEDYQRMLEEQDFACAICRKPENAKAPHAPRTRALSVDHDHETGLVRGLLCGDCNTAVGLLHDDPLIAEQVAVYLRSFS